MDDDNDSMVEPVQHVKNDTSVKGGLVIIIDPKYPSGGKFTARQSAKLMEYISHILGMDSKFLAKLPSDTRF